jgi:ribonuclease HI
MPITKIFTDGSTLNNQKSKKGFSFGGCGGYILFSNGQEQVFTEPLEGEKITNQVAELTALKYALEIVLPKVPKDLLYIYTDSMYIINIYTSWIKKWINDKWIKPDGKNVENADLIRDIYNLIIFNNLKVFFKHVKAHQEPPQDTNSNEYRIWYGNNKADELAIYSANISKENNISKIMSKINKKSNDI